MEADLDYLAIDGLNGIDTTGDIMAAQQAFKDQLKRGESRLEEATLAKLRKEKKIMYKTSDDTPACYWFFGLLWCACTDPTVLITERNITASDWYCSPTSWGCCKRVTDSMAIENVRSVTRRQGPCSLMTSNCCSCCVEDMASLELMGDDASHSGGWTIQRIHKSAAISRELTKILQEVHKNTNLQTLAMDRKFKHVQNS